MLVNSAAYRINLAAMEACLEAGCHYVDLGGLYHVTKQQLELSPKFEQRGLVAMLGVGSAPGKTNLLAERAVRELGGEADSISVVAAGRDLDPPEGLAFPYALRTLLDEITMPPMALIDGEPRELEPLQPGPTVDFGEPIGEAETIFTLHSEVLTFGESFGAEDVTFALSLPPKVLEALQGAGRGERGADRGDRPLRIAPVGEHHLGAPLRRHQGRANGARPERHPGPRALGSGRRHRLDRLAGRRGRAPAGAQADHRDRGAATRALHRPGRDVRRAGDPRRPLRRHDARCEEDRGFRMKDRESPPRSRTTSTASR